MSFLSPRHRLNPVAGAWIGVLAPAIALSAVGITVLATHYDVPLGIAFVLVLAHAGTLPLALVRPRVAGVLGVLLALAVISHSATAGAGPWPWPVPTMLTQFLLVLILGLRLPFITGLITHLCGALGAMILALSIATTHPGASIAANLVIYTAIGGGVLGIAVILRQWGRIRGQLLTERAVSAEEYSKRLLAEEKTRIARELHDVIAHSMSIITVQASTASYRLPGMAAEVEAEFADIAGSSRQALAEMRSLLAVLREDDTSPDHAPQPSIEDLEELAIQARNAGVRVELSQPADLASGVRPVTGLAAYRIVQEALSNALRHAPGSAITITLSRSKNAVGLLIENSPPVSPAQPTLGGGHGIRGMFERATGAGGVLYPGPTAEGGYRVRATLPLGTTLPEREDIR